MLRKIFPRSAVGAAALGLAILAAARFFDAHPPAAAHLDQAVAHVVPPIVQQRGAALDPAYALAFTPVSLGGGEPVSARFSWAEPASAVSVAQAEIALPTTAPVSPLVQAVPLPTRRPPELAAQAETTTIRAPGRQFVQRRRMSVIAAANPSDTRSFFEKLFGMGQAPGPMLAYAAPETGVLDAARRMTSVPGPLADRWAAIYDITAHIVTMPDGTRLEAHSGLGNRLDDPSHVHERMRGPTPPQVYDLKLREQLFHGVRALRLTPIGVGSTFGRTGLLAHTYMLGPNGDSNGCVSFKNYDAFLQAYLNGNVKRLVVVARQS